MRATSAARVVAATAAVRAVIAENETRGDLVLLEEVGDGGGKQASASQNGGGRQGLAHLEIITLSPINKHNFSTMSSRKKKNLVLWSLFWLRFS